MPHPNTTFATKVGRSIKSMKNSFVQERQLYSPWYPGRIADLRAENLKTKSLKGLQDIYLRNIFNKRTGLMIYIS